MKLLTLSTASPAEYLTLIEATPGAYRHIFRGQGDAAWGLVPALYRIANTGIASDTLEQKYDFFERQCLERFFDEGLPYLPSLQRSYSVDRIVAQHFGVPTRLVDWTTDPLVALFFAVERWDTSADAAVFSLLPDAWYKPEHVKSLGPHKAIAFRPPAIDRRIAAQKSVFTFHPYGDDPSKPFEPLDQRRDIGNQITVPGGVERGFSKLLVPANLKRQLHQILLGMGIDRRNLFPGLDGVGADLSARSKTGHVW